MKVSRASKEALRLCWNNSEWRKYFRETFQWIKKYFFWMENVEKFIALILHFWLNSTDNWKIFHSLALNNLKCLNVDWNLLLWTWKINLVDQKLSKLSWKFNKKKLSIFCRDNFGIVIRFLRLFNCIGMYEKNRPNQTMNGKFASRLIRMRLMSKNSGKIHDITRMWKIALSPSISRQKNDLTEGRNSIKETLMKPSVDTGIITQTWDSQCHRFVVDTILILDEIKIWIFNLINVNVTADAEMFFSF